MDREHSGGQRPQKLSPAMERALLSYYRGRPFEYLEGRSQYGGASGTRFGLIRRGLISTDDKLTDLGRRHAALLASI